MFLTLIRNMENKFKHLVVGLSRTLNTTISHMLPHNLKALSIRFVLWWNSVSLISF